MWNFSKNHYLQNKQNARLLVTERIQYFSHLLNVKHGRISIRNQKTRWGSCSRSGNLNFNYRIIHLPSQLQDYIVVHELCHLIEFNHSKSFWALVENILPNYKLLRIELNKYHI